MSATDALVEAFDRDGFVNLPSVLSQEEVEELRSELELRIDILFRGRQHDVRSPKLARDLGKPWGRNLYQTTSMWHASAAFRRLIGHPTIVEFCARIARANSLQLWSDTVQYKPALTGSHFHWHQDAPYHVSIEPPWRVFAAWVALDDADEESGCMWMVPGSYRWGEQERHLWSYMHRSELDAFIDIGPPPDVDSAWQPPRPCRVRAGDVHYHHAYTWHGSPVNHSPRSRRGYTIHYMTDDVRVSNQKDFKLPLPPGTPVSEASPDWFPVMYRTSETSAGRSS